MGKTEIFPQEKKSEKNERKIYNQNELFNVIRLEVGKQSSADNFVAKLI